MTATQQPRKRSRKRGRGRGGTPPPAAPVVAANDLRRGAANPSFDWANGRLDLWAGRYELRQIVGQGLYKVFLLAHDEETDSEVVVGIYVEHPAAEVADSVERHLSVQACGRHPNVMTVLDGGIALGDDDIHAAFVVAEPIYHSVTINQAVQVNGGPLSVPVVLRAAYGVLSGLEHMHAGGLCHGSCHSQNILTDVAGNVVLVDFDWSQPAGESRELPGALTQIVGRHQISPETLLGLPYDQKTDLFSAGLALYRGSTGLHPFDTVIYPANESKHANGAGHSHDFLARLDRLPVTPATINPALPKRFADLLLKMLTPDPASRPPSATAALEELLAIQYPFPTYEASTAIRKDTHHVRTP